MNQAMGMEKKISNNPTNAKNQELVLTNSQKKMKAKENKANMASFGQWI